MKDQKISKKQRKKGEVFGSETVLEKIKSKTPWIFGNKLRKPKIIFPKFRSPKLSLPIPLRSLGLITIYIILFVLQTGIVYLIIRKPPALRADSRRKPVFVVPENIHEAYIIESIVASILLFFSSFGFIILYYSSRYVYNKKFADWILVIGILMIIISFVLLQFMLGIKIPKKPGE